LIALGHCGRAVAAEARKHDAVTAAAVCTAEKYRNRGGNGRTSEDFNGRSATVKGMFSNVDSMCLQDGMQKVEDAANAATVPASSSVTGTSFKMKACGDKACSLPRG
jgi:hypothetical protein